MYNQPDFTENNQQVLQEFIRQHPFAFLCGCDANHKPVATQVPVFLEESGGGLFLTGHLMRDTDHCRAFENSPSVLCVFTGPQAYVSACWYSQPQQASTWNYQSVQVQGRIRFLDTIALEAVLQKTSLHFEENNAASPTVYNNLPEDYRSRLLPAIVAFEVAVEAIHGIFKLSQNKDAESYRAIVKNLQAQEGDAAKLAVEMQKRAAQIFGE